MTYAPKVKVDEQPVLLDLSRSKMGLPEECLAASVAMLDVLTGAVKLLYSEDALIGTANEKNWRTHLNYS